MQANEDNTWFANPGISQVHPPTPHPQPPAHPLNTPLGKFSDGAIVVGDTTNCPARVDECRVVGRDTVQCILQMGEYRGCSRLVGSRIAL